MSTKNDIHNKLEAVFCPTFLDVFDDSHKHTGHAHAREEGSHMRIILVSDAFKGLNRILRHKKVYTALDDFLNPVKKEIPVHALQLSLFTPEEWSTRHE